MNSFFILLSICFIVIGALALSLFNDERKLRERRRELSKRKDVKADE